MSSQSGYVPMVLMQNGHMGHPPGSSRPPTSQQPQQNGMSTKEAAHSNVRPPTFDEALHLTPLTSIVPFTHRKSDCDALPFTCGSVEPSQSSTLPFNFAASAQRTLLTILCRGPSVSRIHVTSQTRHLSYLRSTSVCKAISQLSRELEW
jgi:hypothetical protein